MHFILTAQLAGSTWIIGAEILVGDSTVFPATTKWESPFALPVAAQSVNSLFRLCPSRPTLAYSFLSGFPLPLLKSTSLYYLQKK